MSPWFALGLAPALQPWALIGAGAATVVEARLSSWESFLALFLYCVLILVVNSGSCGEAKFEACQVAGSSSVQWRAGPVGLQPEQVERAGHVHVVQAGLGQAAVAGAARAVADSLVHGALDAGPAGVVSLEGHGLFRGAGGGLGLGRSRGGSVRCLRLAPLVVHRARAGQGPQSRAEKVATMASLPCWVHGAHDADVLPCGQVTVRAS
jgi:hypothetical protein